MAFAVSESVNGDPAMRCTAYLLYLLDLLELLSLKGGDSQPLVR